MFEDSTFESSGKIRKATKSGRWMMFTFIVNGSILLLLILIPLIYPEALPKEAMATLLIAPPPPPPPHRRRRRLRSFTSSMCSRR